MTLILDDFKLRDSIHTIDEICDIIGEARDAYDGVPLSSGAKGKDGVPELRKARSLHSASQKFNNNSRATKPKVYIQQTSNGMLGTRMAVITPTVIPNSSGRWQSYIVDADSLGKLRYKFVNLGPKNGAIIENRLTSVRAFQPHQWQRRKIQPDFESAKMFTIRVNQSTGLTDYMKTPVTELQREWVTPEETMVLYMKFNNYTEDEDGNVGYRNVFASICPLRDGMAPADITWRNVNTWAKMIPVITFDLNRPDFPLDEQDRVMAMAALSDLN